ncbi:MAG: T9SS type A sorting domain-containing protein [Bacteroidales bacterium]|nr:T9SS type A sorting domain-containing protein [Bacteroidales bacterium]
MKRLFQILLILISSSIFSQNIWEPIIIPDSLLAYNIYAEKEGILFIGATSNLGLTGLFKSTDNGKTWVFVQIDSLISSNYINAIRYNQDNMLFISATWGVYRSIDDGDTFEKVSPNTWEISKIIVSPNNEIYAVGWIGILRSIDNGITWDTLYDANNSQYFSDIDFGLNGEIYAVGGKYGQYGTGFFKSLDDGQTWEETGPEYGHLRSVQVNSVGTIIVSGFSMDKVFHSYDNGLTWTIVSNICADVLESYSENRLIAGRNINCYTGCWFSEDWGNTWINLVDDILNPDVMHISISPTNTVYIQSYYSSLYDHHLFRSINPIVSTNNNKYQSKIEIFPNPAIEKILITKNTGEKIDNFIICSLTGRKILTGKIYDNSIDISTLKTGIYIIELISNNGIIRKKIVKK